MAVSGWLGLTSVTVAHADDHAPGDTSDRRRIAFDVETLYWVGTFAHADGTVVLRDHALGGLGLRRVPFGLSLGRSVAERWVLGTRLDIAFEPGRTSDASRLVLRGTIGPYVELLIARDRHIRPFVLARAGLGGALSIGAQDTDDTGEIRIERAPAWYPTVGGGLGSHVFLSEALSFDAMVALDYRWNFVRSSNATFQWRQRDGTLSTAFVLGFSHWW